MPLPSSGAISLNQMHIEVGGTSGTTCSLNDNDIRGLIPNRPSGALSRFSDFHGRSFNVGTQILSGNASHTVSGQYNPAEYYVGALSPHKVFHIYQPPLCTNVPVFTFNGRSTYCARVLFNISSQIQMTLVDISGGVVTTGNGYPANSGWNTMKLVGNGSTRTYARAAATYSNSQFNMYINGSTSLSLYSASTWAWSNQTNPFPASHNTTAFTVTIS